MEEKSLGTKDFGGKSESVTTSTRCLDLLNKWETAFAVSRKITAYR
jgi:hypothetical protein